jgi:hypothetical protein
LNVHWPRSAPKRSTELLLEEVTASSSGISNIEVFDLPLTETNGATVGKKGAKPPLAKRHSQDQF